MKSYNKTILTVAFLVVGFFSYASFAEAAARFWVGGTGTWDASDTSHWSATSGGSSGASVPGASDTVTLDGSSGGGTVTVSATVTVTSITMGAFTGTLDLNGQTIDASTFSLTGTGTRTLTMGSSAINVSGTGTAWNAGTLTNCTISSNTATVTMSGAGATFSSAGATNWNGLSIVFSGSGQATISSDAGTYANITRTGTATKTDTFVISRMTITGTLTLAGNSASNRLLVLSNSFGTARTITNTGATMTWSNVDFRDVDLSTAYDCSGITGGCGNAGNNTDITFTTAQPNYWVGDTGDWSDVNEWASSSGGTGGTGRVPLPQDDATFDANSFSTTGFTVTGDMPRSGKNISFASVGSDNPTMTWSIATTIYGSLTLASGMTNGNAGNLGFAFEGRGAFTLTSAGVELWPAITIQMIGGTLTLQDALNTGRTFTLSNGTLDANDFNVTATIVSVTGTGTRTLNMGSGTWTVNSTGGVWNATTLTNMTFNEETSTILVSNTTATAKTFAGGGTTYYTLTISGDNVTLTGNNTFTNLNLNNPNYTNGTKFTGTSTTTITTLFSTNATTTAARVVATSTNASVYELKFTGGGTVCVNYMTFARTLGTPASTWFVGADSSDAGNNSGLSFTTCAVGSVTTPSVIFKGNVLLKGDTLLK